MKNVLLLGDVILQTAVDEANPSNFISQFTGTDLMLADGLKNKFNVIFVTKLPENHLGDAALNILREKGFDCSYVKKMGQGTIGTCYFFDGKLSSINREKSVFANVKTFEFDYDKLVENADIVVVKLATAEVTYKTLLVTLKLFKKARANGVKTVLDISNDMVYDVKIARINAERLLVNVDMAFGDEGSYKQLFGADVDYERYLKDTFGVKNVVVATANTSLTDFLEE